MQGDKQFPLIYIFTVYVRIALIYIAPLMLITVFYGAIAVILRRKDKVLRHNDQIKRQATRLSICVVITFYILFLPFITLLRSSDIITAEKSGLLYNALWLCTSLSISLSSTSNPIICFTFVESFRRGLREMFNSRQSNSVNNENVARGEQEGITL